MPSVVYMSSPGAVDARPPPPRAGSEASGCERSRLSGHERKAARRSHYVAVHRARDPSAAALTAHLREPSLRRSASIVGRASRCRWGFWERPCGGLLQLARRRSLRYSSSGSRRPRRRPITCPCRPETDASLRSPRRPYRRTSRPIAPQPHYRARSGRGPSPSRTGARRRNTRRYPRFRQTRLQAPIRSRRRSRPAGPPTTAQRSGGSWSDWWHRFHRRTQARPHRDRRRGVPSRTASSVASLGTSARLLHQQTRWLPLVSPATHNGTAAIR